jgi:hypothetical protein
MTADWALFLVHIAYDFARATGQKSPRNTNDLARMLHKTGRDYWLRGGVEPVPVQAWLGQSRSTNWVTSGSISVAQRS